jgi:hypothetical protein
MVGLPAYTPSVGQPKMPVDITSYSFDEFVSFLFAHDVPNATEKYNPWYWHVEVTHDPQQTCQYYVQLFSRPEFLLQRFSRGQLEEGFWAIQSGTLDCAVITSFGRRACPSQCGKSA